MPSPKTYDYHHRRRRLGRLRAGQPALRRQGQPGAAARSRRLGPRSRGSRSRSAGARMSASSASTTGCILPSPKPRPAGAASNAPRGRVIGGSSSINAMAYVRGHRGDYDRWAAARTDGQWSYAHVLPYFRRQESWKGGASFYRGGDGPLTTQMTRFCRSAGRCLMPASGACRRLSKTTPDYNGRPAGRFWPSGR